MKMMTQPNRSPIARGTHSRTVGTLSEPFVRDPVLIALRLRYRIRSIREVMPGWSRDARWAARYEFVDVLFQRSAAVTIGISR